jgi:ADP-heptose:LPS heptosyltransferase
VNIQFQRTVDRLAGIPICAALSLAERVRRFFTPAAAQRPPERILIVLLSEMGSLVLASPMFAELRRRYPGASLHMLMFAKNREVLDLQNVMPRENVITLNDKALGRFAADSLRAIWAMRRLKPDVVIDCELFSRVSSIFSYLSGAPVRVGFHPHNQEGLYRGSYINRPVQYSPYHHLSDQFLTLAAAIESRSFPLAKGITKKAPPPHVPFSEEELRQVRQQLHRDFPVVAGRKLVLVYPGGGILPIRAWPADSYKQLSRALLSEGYAIGLIGLKEDKALAQDIVAHCEDPHCVDLTGYTTSVRHLLALFHQAALLVTNDGGPGQFAALTPLPTLVFFGPETPALYSPLAPNIHCLYQPLSCSPCLTAYNHRASACDGDNQCLKQITPAHVLAQARILLRCPSTWKAAA